MRISGLSVVSQLSLSCRSVVAQLSLSRRSVASQLPLSCLSVASYLLPVVFVVELEDLVVFVVKSWSIRSFHACLGTTLRVSVISKKKNITINIIKYVHTIYDRFSRTEVVHYRRFLSPCSKAPFRVVESKMTIAKNNCIALDNLLKKFFSQVKKNQKAVVFRV